MSRATDHYVPVCAAAVAERMQLLTENRCVAAKSSMMASLD